MEAPRPVWVSGHSVYPNRPKCCKRSNPRSIGCVGRGQNPTFEKNTLCPQGTSTKPERRGGFASVHPRSKSLGPSMGECRNCYRGHESQTNVAAIVAATSHTANLDRFCKLNLDAVICRIQGNRLCVAKTYGVGCHRALQSG